MGEIRRTIRRAIEKHKLQIQQGIRGATGNRGPGIKAVVCCRDEYLTYSEFYFALWQSHSGLGPGILVEASIRRRNGLDSQIIETSSLLDRQGHCDRSRYTGACTADVEVEPPCRC